MTDYLVCTSQASVMTGCLECASQAGVTADYQVRASQARITAGCLECASQVDFVQS